MTKAAAPVAVLAVLLLCGAAAAPGGGSAPAAPGASAARPPAAPVPLTFVTADSVTLSGRWFPGPPGASTVVLAPARRGASEALHAAAAEFQRRGFNALCFVLRDPAPTVARPDPQSDSLYYLVVASRWMEDTAAALRAARSRTDDASHVFAWGEGVGGALAVGGAIRVPEACDGLAAGHLFRFVDDVMRENGTSQIPEAGQLHVRLLRPGDEPLSAAARLAMPVYAELTGPAAGTAGDVTLSILRRNRGRTDRWLRPGVTAPGLAPTPAEVDTLAEWFRRMSRFPRRR